MSTLCCIPSFVKGSPCCVPVDAALLQGPPRVILHLSMEGGYQ